MSFWHTLKKPFFTLAPMADVTDPAYRKLIAETSPPDVMWTEFVSADGLFHTREKKKMNDEENPLVRDLLYSSTEHLIVAQFFTSNPESMEYAAAFARERGFDGIDINMGCPDASIEKQGAGAAHIKNPERAKEVIRAAKRGAGSLPVSVKTRIGYNTMEWEKWLPAVLEEEIDALTVHLRTRKEMSKVAAHWELAGDIAALVRNQRPDVLLSGNGDVTTRADAREKTEKYGLDGVMLGRGIFGNPWLFSGRALEDVSQEEKLKALHTLARYFDELRPQKHFAILKKHFKAFVCGFDGASELRTKLMDTSDLSSFEAVLQDSGYLLG